MLRPWVPWEGGQSLCSLCACWGTRDAPELFLDACMLRVWMFSGMELDPQVYDSASLAAGQFLALGWGFSIITLLRWSKIPCP